MANSLKIPIQNKTQAPHINGLKLPPQNKSAEQIIAARIPQSKITNLNQIKPFKKPEASQKQVNNPLAELRLLQQQRKFLGQTNNIVSVLPKAENKPIQGANNRLSNVSELSPNNIVSFAPPASKRTEFEPSSKLLDVKA